MTDARNAVLGDAQNQGWGPPCPTTSITSIAVGGRTFNVHRRVAPIFRAFIGELVRRGYPIDRGTLDDWSYVCRHIAGSTAWSNHAWGLAVDINSLTNPRTSPLTTDMPAWVRNSTDLLARYGLRWGGAYQSSTPDPMHFEFVLTPADADRIAAALDGGPVGGWWTVSIPDTELDKVEDRYRKALGIDASTSFLTAVRNLLRQGTTGDPDVPMIAWSVNLKNTLAAVSTKTDALAAAVRAGEDRDRAEVARDAALLGVVTAIDTTGVNDAQVRQLAQELAAQLNMDPDVILDRLADRLAPDQRAASEGAS